MTRWSSESFIVDSYIVVRSPEGQRLAPANDERCTMSAVPTCRVETMLMTADGLQLTACGPDEDGIRIACRTGGWGLTAYGP